MTIPHAHSPYGLLWPRWEGGASRPTGLRSVRPSEAPSTQPERPTRRLTDVVPLPLSQEAVAAYVAVRSRQLAQTLANAGMSDYAEVYACLAAWLEEDYTVPPPAVPA